MCVYAHAESLGMHKLISYSYSAVFELLGGGVELPPALLPTPPPQLMSVPRAWGSAVTPSTLDIFTTDMFLQYAQTWTSLKSSYARRPLPRLSRRYCKYWLDCNDSAVNSIL